MKCSYCGFELEDDEISCSRCGSKVPEEALETESEASADVVACPSCGADNNSSAEYCTQCGSPMAIITRVMTLSRAREREPLETWRVYGIETSMVGREAELEALFDAHDRMVDNGKMRTLRVVGQMGLGKSRLFAEFQRQLDERFAETYVMQAESRDEASGPYAMFERLLKNRFYIAEKEHPETAQRKLVEAVDTIMGESGNPERIAHLVGQLIDVEFDESPYVPSVRDSEGASELDRRSFDALSELLAKDAQRNPLVIILEDLQYATFQSLHLVEFLRRQLADEPVLLIVSWNSEEVFGTELDELEFDSEIELTPLADKEVEFFLRDTLRRAEEIPDHFVERISDAAHGNPLTVEEILRILISQGIIDTRTQEWKLHLDKFEDVELPKTIEGAVEARLRTLTVEERTVMGMAACVGQVFWTELVIAIYHVWEDHQTQRPAYWAEEAVDTRIEEILESLERKDMIRRADDSVAPGKEQFYFKHRIEPKKIYESVSAQEKQRYHRVIAQWLLRHFRGDLERVGESIADHFDRARCLDQAAYWYLESASIARRRYDNRHAIDLYIRGLSYLSDANIEEKMSAFHDLGSVYDFLGEYDQALAYYREMLRFAWMLNDRARGGVAYNKIGRAYRSLGEYDDALEHFELALELFRSFDDTRGIASTLDDIGKIYWIRGDFEEAEKFYTAGLHLRRSSADDRSVALSLNHLGSLKLQRGLQKDAMVYFREALDIRRNLDDRQGLVDSFNNLGALLHDRGEHDQALTLFEAALETAREIGYRSVEGIILNNLAETQLIAGDYQEARKLLNEAMKVSEEAGEKRALFDILRNLGKLELRELNRSVALDRVSEALQIANQLDSNLLIGIGMQSLADVHAGHIFDPALKDESIKLATECYKDAIALLREVGNDSELARCLSSYGQFQVERGEVVHGRKNLERASEIFERLEMRKMLEQTDRLLGALS